MILQIHTLSGILNTVERLKLRLQTYLNVTPVSIYRNFGFVVYFIETQAAVTKINCNMRLIHEINKSILTFLSYTFKINKKVINACHSNL